MNLAPSAALPPQTAAPPDRHMRDAQIRTAAEKLETAFLTEMLRAAGAGSARSSFGGGNGEEQFASFLLEAQAAEMVRAGGIGLAESLFDAMKGRSDAG